MAKRNSTILPGSGASGGLLGGFSGEHTTKVQFSPKLVILFSLLVVLIIFIFFKTNFIF